MRNVDNGTRHASDHDNASRCLPLHEVLRNCDSIQVGAINVDTPELLHTVVRVGYRIVVLSEASGCDEVVDLAVSL